LRLALDDETEHPSGSSSQPSLPPGLKSRFFGDYELLEEISRGGMGLVYRARQLSLNRVVALKMIHGAHLASPEARLRFRVEIETIAQLNHPNIVSLYEAGEHDGTHFFSMRLIEGTNLGRHVQQRPSLRESARLLVKICRAVHYAHQRGILHRDLKPSNILIDLEGEPHVVDFGLAKTLARESGFTFHESILGSPNYMAPEQAAGRTAQLTTTADVYGIGTIMYEMLTGRPPFQASTPLDTIRKVVDEEPTPPRKFNGAVDVDLETICLRCLQKNPAARYSSAEELAKDLERWLEGKAILARPVGRLEQVWRWSRREPALAGALGVSLVLLLTLAVGSCVAALRIGRAEREARANLRDSLLNQAHLLRLTAGLGQRTEGLRLVRQALSLGGPVAFRDRARDELLALLVRNDLQLVSQPSLRGSSDPALNVTDPQLARHASLIGSNTVVVRRIADGTELFSFSCGDAPVRGLEQFSHEGKYLALRHLDGISIWNVESGERCFATNGPNRVFCFAANEPVLVLEEWECQASFLELPGMREIRRLQGTPNIPNDPRFGWTAMALSPDGNQLAVIRPEVVEVLDVKTNQIQWRFTNSAPVLALAWSPNSRRLAASLSNGRIAVWNIANGTRPINTLPKAAFAHTLAFNPSGNLLAAAFNDRVLRFLDLTAIRGGFETEVRCDAHRLAFSEDGKRVGLVFRGHEPNWLEIVPSSDFQEFNVASTTIQLDGCSFSPDGRIIAVGTATNVVLCNPATGARLASLANWRISAFCFDPWDPFVIAARSPGVFRWAVSGADASPVQFANEQQILSGRGWRALTFSADGEVFAAANARSNAVFIFDRTFTNQLAQLGPHAGTDSVVISPHREWLATGSSADRQIKVWDLRTGAEVLPLAVGPAPRAAFSDDGKWLATFGDTFELRATGSWKPAPLAFGDPPSVFGAVAFSRDSRLLAVVRDLERIQLVDLHTLRPLGVLHPPGDGEINAVAFSPDGTRLVSVGQAARLRVWNLRQIRQELAELDLDWDIPGFPPAP
jgi:eukaryotic-like serine/threonine-protein kinase